MARAVGAAPALAGTPSNAPSTAARRRPQPRGAVRCCLLPPTVIGYWHCYRGAREWHIPPSPSMRPGGRATAVARSAMAHDEGEKGRPTVAAPPPETRPVPTSTDRIERRGGGEATPRNERKLGGVVARSGGSEGRCARRVIAASSHGQQHPLLDEADEGRQYSAQWLPRTPIQ